MIHMAHRCYRGHCSINVEEGIAGKKHLAEIDPRRKAGVRLRGVLVAIELRSRKRLAATRSSGSGTRLMQNKKAFVMRKSVGIGNHRSKLPPVPHARPAFRPSDHKIRVEQAQRLKGIVDDERRVQVVTIEGASNTSSRLSV